MTPRFGLTLCAAAMATCSSALAAPAQSRRIFSSAGKSLPAKGAVSKAARARVRGSAVATPPMTPSAASHWGVLGVMAILANAIGRLAPIAIEPLKRGGLVPGHWVAYVAMIATFAYVEGYKAFQLKFSPLVVSRAFTLGPEGGRATFMRSFLAPFYSMGLFHATRKRKIVSWSISIAVLIIVGLVKRLPYPWRSIVDAGVLSGLTWGVTSIGCIYAKALGGTLPAISTELPPK
ncbi:hypothetical protein T492DRAFT_1036022 [Pavlovales sp. CCMP2436]|nr:hypothetical protein T492DRAFT_1036022 [Pavlovales sp. CCMP2436]